MGKVILTAILICGPFAVFAYEEEREISVAVPRTELQLESYNHKKKRASEFSISASNYAPENYRRGSYAGGESQLKPTSVPSIGLTRIAELYSEENLHLSSKLGGGFMQLERSTPQVPGSSLTFSGSQRVNFMSLRLGVESAFPKVLPWGLEPNMSFSALPTWVTAQRSVYEDTVGGFGIPLEATVGLLWRTPLRASLIRGEMSFGVAYQTVSGSIDRSNLRGKGVLGEFRISL